MKSYPMVKMVFLIFLALFLSHCATQSSVVQSPPAETAAPAGKLSVIEKISLVEGGNYSRILVEGSEPIALPFYKLLTDPLRISIDIPNIDLKQVKAPIRVENGTIGDVSATQYNGKGRIEIGLVQMANYNISREDRVLTIDIEKVRPVAEVKEVPKEEGPVKVTEIPPEAPKKEEAPAPPPAAPPLKKAKEVVTFQWEDKKEFVVFNIVADGTIENYNAFKLDAPSRLVLDLWAVGTRYPQKSVTIKNPFIQKMRIGRYPDKLRVVFDSSKSEIPPYQINRIDDKLVVSFGNVPQPSEPQIFIQEKTKAPSAADKKKSGKSGTVTRIDFKQMDRKSRIIIGTTEEPQFESRMVSKDAFAVELKNAFVPKRLQRPLDTSQFDSAVNTIQIQNVKAGKGNDVRISVTLKEEAPYETVQEGKLLFIDIGDIGAPKKVEVKKEEMKREEGKKEEVKATPEATREEKPLPPAEAEVTAKTGEEKKVVEEGLPEKVYTGRKVSLDFKDADIKNILRLIAEVSNLNIITGDDVQGKITMRLVDVPWDQALDVILQSRSLGKSQVGNVLRIAPLDTLKKEEQAILEDKRAKEKLEDLVTELIPINYATGNEIMPQIKNVLSERGDIKVDQRTNTLIVKDIARNVALAKSLVKSLDTKTPQVLIEARIVEASLNFQRELGVSWGLKVSGGVGAGTGTVQGGVNAANNIVNLPAVTTGAGVIQGVLAGIGSLDLLDIAISAHENAGDVRIISSPKIATLDNKEASIEQGLRIPYLKLTTEGTVTTDFIDANLKLTVTPHVTNDGNVKLNIKAKKDAPDWVNKVSGVPSIDKKEAITEVLVSDNGMVVIAGIYTIEKNETVEGIPLFSKIPLLGWLFKRESKQDQRKDLLIFISPKIMKDQI
ncbi:MAG: type IV pilus secretin PilQ [Deltaproteobacteria bacterium]